MFVHERRPPLWYIRFTLKARPLQQNPGEPCSWVTDKVLDEPRWRPCHRRHRYLSGRWSSSMSRFTRPYSSHFSASAVGTGVRGLKIGLAILPQDNQKPLVVKDNVGRPQVSLGWQVRGMR